MIPFQPIDDDASVLQHSPLLRAALLTCDYIDAHGPIGLTASKALKRYFVEWAARAFDWPGYSADDLYAINKVLNEGDFPPLTVLHDVLLSAKVARHYKGHLHLTKQGQQLRKHPGALWDVLANHLLCVLDPSVYSRFGERLEGNWDVFLNIVNVEAQSGVTDDRLCSVLFGVAEEALKLDYHLRPLTYVYVLRPLAWAGLLAEHRDRDDRLFTKTPLWVAALKLQTDDFLRPVTRH
jgi:hypothetical protein